jgi:hypothetical protein
VAVDEAQRRCNSCQQVSLHSLHAMAWCSPEPLLSVVPFLQTVYATLLVQACVRVKKHGVSLQPDQMQLLQASISSSLQATVSVPSAQHSWQQQAFQAVPAPHWLP